MKLPKKISLMGRDVEVVCQDEPILNERGEELAGQCDSTNRRIMIHNDQAPHEKIETVFHEAAHFYLTQTGWDQKLTDNEVEIMCQLLTNFTVDIIKAFHQKKRTRRKKQTK